MHKLIKVAVILVASIPLGLRVGASASSEDRAIPVTMAIPRGYHRLALPCCTAPITFGAIWKVGDASGAPTITIIEQTLEAPLGIRDYLAATPLVPGQGQRLITYGSNCGKPVATVRSDYQIHSLHLSMLQIALVSGNRAISITYAHKFGTEADTAVENAVTRACIRTH